MKLHRRPRGSSRQPGGRYEREGKGKEEKDVWAHKGGEWSVMRRYSDFLFLYSVLVAGCIAPGRIVPGIPGKVCVCVIF